MPTKAAATPAATNGRAPKPKGKLESYDPATGELLGAVDTIGPKDVQAVVDDVGRVQPFWAELTLEARAGYMDDAKKALVDAMDEVAELLTREQGKPRNEAYSMEVVPTIDGLHWIAKNGPDLLEDEKLSYPQLYFKAKRSRIVFEPLGVVGVIAPWNYPWSIPFGEVAMALMAGNGVVLKPASLTPLLGERIRQVFEDGGLPKGLIQVVHGGGAVGQALAESSAAKVFFTGSVEVGYKVGEACAQRMKGSVLELGGKDPAIVCADCDLDKTISGVLWGAFANAGQTCSGIERIYVVEEIAERFISGLVNEAAALRIGNPIAWETEIGPMVSTDQYSLVNELVDDALAKGAERRCGGPMRPPGLSDTFIAPTVLTGVRPDMRIMREEIFGPVAPVTVVADEEEAIRLANDSDFGLGASVWTKDRQKGERIALRIESGMVWINDHSYSHAALQTPWGGVKDSGLGRAHSRLGFEECVSAKHVAWEPQLTRQFWWHPYDRSLGRMLQAAGRILYGTKAQRAIAVSGGLLPVLRIGSRMLRKRRL